MSAIKHLALAHQPRMVGISHRVPVVAVLFGGLLFAAGMGVALADGQRNACGCYADGAGNCYCDRAAKCGCPGLCEPRGCEDERERQLNKEIEAETRRAREQDRAAQAQGQGEGEGQAQAQAPVDDEKDDEQESTPAKSAGPGAGLKAGPARGAGAGEGLKTASTVVPSPPRPAAHTRKLTSRQQRDLAHLLELYLAAAPDRRAMSADDVLRALTPASAEPKRP